MSIQSAQVPDSKSLHARAIGGISPPQGTYVKLLGSTDLLPVWWIVNDALGFGVLNRRRPPASVVRAMLAIDAVVIVAFAVSAPFSLECK